MIKCWIKQIFADYTKAISIIKSKDDISSLQDDQIRWSDKWLVKFNNGKCKVMHIGENNPNAEYTMLKQLIERKKSIIFKLYFENSWDMFRLTPSSEWIISFIKDSIKNKKLGLIKHTFKYLDEFSTTLIYFIGSTTIGICYCNLESIHEKGYWKNLKTTT